MTNGCFNLTLYLQEVSAMPRGLWTSRKTPTSRRSQAIAADELINQRNQGNWLVPLAINFNKQYQSNRWDLPLALNIFIQSSYMISSRWVLEQKTMHLRNLTLSKLSWRGKIYLSRSQSGPSHGFTKSSPSKTIPETIMPTANLCHNHLNISDQNSAFSLRFTTISYSKPWLRKWGDIHLFSAVLK
jgi:hypothetical protein